MTRFEYKPSVPYTEKTELDSVLLIVSIYKSHIISYVDVGIYVIRNYIGFDILMLIPLTYPNPM